jgi:hypothetical protein
MINVLPISSILIVAGLILLSAVVANRAKGLVLFGQKVSRTITLFGAIFCVVGIILHFESPIPERINAPEIIKPALSESKEFQVSFEPKMAAWGQRVLLKVMPPVDRADVYLNDNPLPSVAKGNGVFVVTIPSISKSGYFTVSTNNKKIRSSNELIVLTR